MGSVITTEILDLDWHVEGWRQRMDSDPAADPWDLAICATSDLSEDFMFASWLTGAGAAVQRWAVTGACPWLWGGSPDQDAVAVEALPRLRAILERLGGRWPEYPDMSLRPDGTRDCSDRPFAELPPLGAR